MKENRPLHRMILALMVLDSSSCATLSPGSPLKPYGAATLEQTDTAALSRSLADQAKAQGITHAELNLFPDRLPEGQHQAEMDYSDRGYVVNGLLSGPAGLRYIEQPMLPAARSWIITALCRCASTGSEIVASFKKQRIFAGLHEYFHMVAKFSGDYLSAKCLGMNEELIPRSVGVRCSYNERISDTAAILYIQSDYRDPGNYPAMEEYIRSVEMQPTHYTVSSIAAAMEAYRKHPRPGLTGEQIEHWAVEIVNSQKGLDKEYDFAVQVSRDINEPTLVTLPPDIQYGLKIIAASRAALFGPLPRSRSKHQRMASGGPS
jgi:hypothetical protein